jgi:hypothetical protein
MPYKLYLDKPEEFICEVAVKNASLKNSVARLIIESADGINFVFNGKIEGEKCTVPIRKLKGLLDESAKGNMFLEVIVEDTYFKPWESDFTVEEHTSVKVKVSEVKMSSKPIIEVRVPSPKKQIINERKGINMWIPLHEISHICEKFDIKRSNISKKKQDFQQLIKEYFNANPEFSVHRYSILEQLKNFIK